MHRSPPRDQNKTPSSNKSGIVLNQDFLFMKTRQSLQQITKLNLWGNDLGDVSIIRNLPNLEVLALTVNQINTLQDFQKCYKLKELYLRRNSIPCDYGQLDYLKDLSNLKVLNLSENPISQKQPEFYRLMVIKTIPSLEKLDDIPVNFIEVQKAQNLDASDIPQTSTIESGKPYKKNSDFVATTFIPNESQQFQGKKFQQKQKEKSPEEDIVRAHTAMISNNQPANCFPSKVAQADAVFKPSRRALPRTPPNEFESNGLFVENREGKSGQNYPNEDAESEKPALTPQPKYERRRTDWDVKPPGRQLQTEAKADKNEFQRQMPQPQKVGKFKSDIVPQQQPRQARPVPSDVSPIRANGNVPSPDKKEKQHANGEKQKKPKKKKKNKSENILCAIIALMKELDKSGLEFVKMDAKKRIAKIDQKTQRRANNEEDDDEEENDDSDY